MNNYVEEYITKEIAQKVIKNVFSIYAISNKCLPSEEVINIYIKCMEAIKDTFSSNVRENIKGKWIIEDNIVPITFIDGYVETKRCVCSNCGYKPTYMGRTILPTTKTLLFCPNCGANMRQFSTDRDMDLCKECKRMEQRDK